MLTIESHKLEEGIGKTTSNAKDLIEAAIALRSMETISNSIGYGVLLMQTGLEEAAKASFLFEKYLKSLRKDYIKISNKEWKIWMGGRRSHAQRVARLQYLYALSEQVSAIPGAAIMFPQGVQDMLMNRNAALYVDFRPEWNEFRSPTEVVDSSFLSANAGFAQHMLGFTNYGEAIAIIRSSILNDPSRTTWFVRSIQEEIERKHNDVYSQVIEYEDQVSFDPNKLKEKAEVLFCARVRTDRVLEILHGCVVGTKDESIFFLDEHTNHIAIHPDHSVIHARFTRTIETPLGFRNEWEIIDSLQAIPQQ